VGNVSKDVSEEIVGTTNFPNLSDAVWETEGIALPCFIGINKQPHDFGDPYYGR